MASLSFEYKIQFRTQIIHNIIIELWNVILVFIDIYSYLLQKNVKSS